MGIKNKKPPVAPPLSVPVGIRISPAQAEKLRKDAKDSGRTLSGHVIFFLKIAGAL
jgi:hypothetical protein